jgi:uncharacterized membrane protein
MRTATSNLIILTAQISDVSITGTAMMAIFSLTLQLLKLMLIRDYLYQKLT